jgi:MFS family permease
MTPQNPLLPKLHPIWSNKPFLWLWLSMSIATFGGQITEMVLPLTAVTLLHADAQQMGLLIAMETLPFALFSLPSGVWLDQVRKLPVIRFCYACLILSVSTVPIAAWFGWLSMGQLYIVGFAIGICAVFLGTAMQVFTTQVVGREHLVHAHGAMSASGSAARTAGPATGGALVQLFSAPIVLLVDVCTLSIGLIVLFRIKVTEQLKTVSHVSFIDQIREGIRFVFAEPNLRTLTWAVAIWQVLFHGVLTLQILLATRDLGLTPKQIGIGFAAGGIVAIVGSIMTPRLTTRFSVGPVMMTGFILTACGWAMLAWVTKGEFAFLGFAVAQMLFQAGVSLFFVTYIAMRQVLTPEALLSRVTATMRFMTVAAAPIGALLAGNIGHWIGVHNTIILIAVTSVVLVIAVAFLSPLRNLKMVAPAQS